MSEYQYYEFQSLDSILSEKARTEMERLSSRVYLTANSASFVYNYSDFRGNPRQVLAEHFDAMLYIANWGSRHLMFRFPTQAIPPEIQAAYNYAEVIEWSTSGKYTILEIRQEDEGGFGWVEGEGILPRVVQVRDDIIRGDYRSLYLAWLMAMSQGFGMPDEDEDLPEPPVPPELHKLSPALKHFVAFFEIDIDLVNAAAQGSNRQRQPETSLSDHIEKLPDSEKLDYLKRLLAGESHLNIALARRLREFVDDGLALLPPNEQPRTIRALMALADEVKIQRAEAARQKAEAARQKQLEKVARVEDAYWDSIPQLIEEKRAKAYEQAIDKLKDLRDLAKQRGQLPDFHSKMQDILETYPTLHGLHRRMKEARLLKP